MKDQTNTIREAYKRGWVQASKWAKREDLIADIDSPAYTKDADAALTQLEAMVGAQEPAGWFESPYGAFRANPMLKIQFPPRALNWQIPVYTAAPVAQQRKTVTNDEQASAYMDARLWEFIDMAGMWPRAKPDPRIWAHVMVYAQVAQQYEAGDVASAAAQGFRDGVASVTQQEPKFWYRPVGDDGLYEGPVHNNSIGGKMLRDEKPGEWVPLFEGAAPAAQQYEAGDMASAAAQGFRDGVASVAQQPQCVCGQPTSLGVVHRTDGPCFVYEAQQPQAEAVPVAVLHRGGGGAFRVSVGENLLAVYALPPGDHDLFTRPQQAEAVPPDVVRDAERYRWLRNESWAGYNTGKGTPSVYTVDGAGNRRMMLAEEAMDDAIDAAIAQQKGQP